MDTRKSASHFVREKNDEPSIRTTTSTTTTTTNNNNMIDIELAESKDEPDSTEEQRNKTRAMTKSVVLTIIALVICFCLVSIGGWSLINTRCASIESFRHDCKAKGGYFEHVEASPYLESFLGGRHGSCEGVDGAR
jgi:hypothetical protein